MKKNSKKPIGILGGTFDPIHFGHLRTALELYENLNLQEVRLIPCKQPVHKAQAFSQPEQRRMMVELAISREPGLTLDSRELDRDTPSYMVETLQSLRDEVNDQPLCLIVGLDAFAALETWHQWEKLIELAHIIAIDRPNFKFRWQGNIEKLLKPCVIQHPQQLMDKPAGNVLLQSTTVLNISATVIRDIIQTGKSPRYLMPSAVVEYIYREGIFKKG